MNKIRKYTLLLGTLLSLSMFSCSEDWMSDVVPSDNQDANKAFSTVKDGRNTVNGVFSLMQSEDYYGSDYIVYGDLKAIDVRTTEVDRRDQNMYLYTETTEASTPDMWVRPYTCLVSVNNAIENMDNIIPDGEEGEDAKLEIKANFYALRGLIHFDLLKIFSRIPAAITGDIANELGIVHADHVMAKDEKPARKNLQESYDFVISDLTEAIRLMPNDASTEGWFNKTAVKALLARVHLFRGNNQQAYDLAKEVIADNSFSLIPYGEYKDSWTYNYSNKEAILTLINTTEDNPNREGIGYLWSATGYYTMAITESFIAEINKSEDDRFNAIKEETGTDGSVTYLSLKYPDEIANKLILIRLSEMYFIAAEATFKLNNSNTEEVAQLINTVIEKRTNVANTLSSADINIDRIILEKRKEFIGEGMTFFDLIRNKKDIVRIGDDHLTTAPMIIKYDDFNTIQPIPRIELNTNPNIQQNPGYAE